LEIRLDWDYLKTQKLFLATPMYGGQCFGTYARSICEVVTMFTQRQLPLQLYSLFNESLITRARAYACDEFLRSDATHLLFIDSDIGFAAQDIICMMSLMREEKYDILGLPYPKKCIAYEKVKLAVDKGFADKDPKALEQFTCDMVFNPLPGTQSFSILEPAEMLEVGTGTMMLRRNVLEDYQKAYPEYMFKPDHIRTEHFDGSREICMFFQAEIDRPFLEKPFRAALEEIVWRLSSGKKEDINYAEEIAKTTLAKADKELKEYSKRYLSEDYLFCQKARAIGKHVWLLPWCQTSHTGTHIYTGTVAAMGALGVSATADPAMLGKNQQPAVGAVPPPITALPPKENRQARRRNEKIAKVAKR
jgi:hypothetical protein